MNCFFKVSGVFCLAVCAASAQTPVASTVTVLNVTAGGSAATTIPQGTVVTLTATISATGAPVVPGQVNFCEATAKLCSDIHLIGAAQLTAAGTATIKLVPGPGNHSYKAEFLGTTTNAGSASTASLLTVTPTASDASTTAITASGSPGNYTLTATVTGQGSIAPSGTISFLDTSNSNNLLATAALTAQPGSTTLSFRNSSNPATSPYPQSVVAADFNGDGKLDLAVPIGGSAALDVFLGNGDGTFRDAPQIAVSGVNSAGNAAVADFNGDGNPDVAITLPNNNVIQVLLGKGDGTFTAVTQTSVPYLFAIAAADLNRDGIPDVVTANPATKSLAILLGKGDGTFTAGSSVTTSNDPIWVAVGDFNGDGVADLATTIYSGSTNVPGSVEIFLGKGDGTFTTVASEPAVGYDPIGIVAGDLNRDGILDLAVANLASNTSNPAAVTVLLGKGDGTFTPGTQNLLTGNLPYSVAIGDFNGDGIPDLVTANAGSNTATVFLGRGDGTFTPGPSPSVGIDPVFAAVGDFNGDGLSDIAAALNYPNFEVPVLLSQDSGSQAAIATAGGISVVGPGTHLVDASYPGDANYLPSISGTVALTAVASIVPGFSLVAQPPTQTIAAGAAAEYSLTVTPQNGFNQTVALSCSGLQPGTTCSFSSATISGGSGTSILTVQTTASQPRNQSSPATSRKLLAVAGLLLLFLPFGTRRKWHQWLITGCLFAALATGAAFMTGCNASLLLSGDTSSSAQTILITGSAPNGSQPITANAEVSLIVQAK